MAVRSSIAGLHDRTAKHQKDLSLALDAEDVDLAGMKSIIAEVLKDMKETGRVVKQTQVEFDEAGKNVAGDNVWKTVVRHLVVQPVTTLTSLLELGFPRERRDQLLCRIACG